MEWTDSGYLLSVRRHGESSGILSVLTREHGRHAGLLKGAFSRKKRGGIQPGNCFSLTWRGRLSEQLGTFTCELDRAHAPAFFQSPARLAGLSSACALVDEVLPERAPAEEIWAGFSALLEHLENGDWPLHYVLFEKALLAYAGFPLDLTACAATGKREDLIYVSPRSGRAVSREGGAPYRERLLPLPRFFLEPEGCFSQADVLGGLRLTGHFLAREVLSRRGELPDSRQRLELMLRKKSMPESFCLGDSGVVG